MGAVAAAVIVHQEMEVITAFRAAGATSAEGAKALASLGLHQGIAVSRLISRAVLRQAAPGTYYLDELSWEALRRSRRRIVTVMLVLGVIVIAGIVLGTKS
ncbi:MAG: hypothetical protein ABI765_16760 [Gemmatimonadota bacterium]